MIAPSLLPLAAAAVAAAGQRDADELFRIFVWCNADTGGTGSGAAGQVAMSLLLDLLAERGIRDSKAEVDRMFDAWAEAGRPPPMQLARPRSWELMLFEPSL